MGHRGGRELSELLEQNRRWAATICQEDPHFFSKLTGQQAPEYLWIGCSDSRVPANQIVGMLPGELFVHRNVANVVVHTDLNCLSVLQFAVDVLKVRHVIVCGHYGCGGVLAALRRDRLGLVDNWLRHVQDVAQRHQARFAELSSETDRANLLCELNVIEQVVNVCQTSIVEEAWRRSQPLTVHGWIYDVADGRLRDLGVSVKAMPELEEAVTSALARSGRSLALEVP